MQTTVTSFGYKHGLPLDTDLVIDCRFLPNPHWVEDLRPLTGLDEPVRDYVLGQPAHRPSSSQQLDDLLAMLLPGLRGRGEVVPDRRLRLHGRPPPFGGHRRGGGPVTAREGLRSPGRPPRRRPLRSVRPATLHSGHEPADLIERDPGAARQLAGPAGI